MPVAASTTAVVLLVALVAAEIVLIALSVIDLVRRPSEAVTFGNKLPWYFIVVLFGFIGPIVYFAAGRRDTPVADAPSAPRPEDAGSQDHAGRALDLLYGPDAPEKDD